MSRFGLRAVMLLAVLAGGFGFYRPAAGQDLALNQIYGAGVHEYFAGNYKQAMADLSTVIDGGSNDPRAYYFRGLAAINVGMDATADFEHGAALEAKALDRFYPVSKSLERVQGYARVTLEKYRAHARAAAYQERQKKDQVRYERLRRAEEAVLRQAPIGQGNAIEPAAPAGERPAAPEAAKAAEPAEDPFAAEPEQPAEKGAAPAEEDDPFGDKSRGEEATEEMPAEKEDAPAEADDPFSTGPSNTADEGISSKDAKEELESDLKAEDEAETLPSDIEAADEAEMDEPAAGKKDDEKKADATADDPFADDASEDAAADEKEEPTEEDKPAAKKGDDKKEDDEDPFS